MNGASEELARVLAAEKLHSALMIDPLEDGYIEEGLKKLTIKCFQNFYQTYKQK